MNILKPLRLKQSTRARSHSRLCTCVYLQFSLLSEVRGLVTPQDVERFDGLVLRREIEALKARQGGGAGFQDSFSMVSYPDTLASSSASFMTNTTLSSARVRKNIHIQNEFLNLYWTLVCNYYWIRPSVCIYNFRQEVFKAVHLYWCGMSGKHCCCVWHKKPFSKLVGNLGTKKACADY